MSVPNSSDNPYADSMVMNNDPEYRAWLFRPEPEPESELPWYDECGCYYPCPDHKGRAPRNRDEFADRYDTWNDNVEPVTDDDYCGA